MRINLGFEMGAIGLGPGSWCQARIALGIWTGERGLERLYRVSDVGAAGTGFGPLLAGEARTTEHMGHIFPARDPNRRTFPIHLAGKYVLLEVEGLFRGSTNARVTFNVSDRLRSGQHIPLYEVELEMPIRSSFIGAAAVEGTLEGGRIIYDFEDRQRRAFQEIMRIG